jgi:hypothetical protein
VTMRALTVDERAKLRALASTVQALARVTRAHTDTLRLALAGGLLAPPTIKRLRDAIAKGDVDEK